MTLAKVKEQDGMTLAKVKEQDGMTVCKSKTRPSEPRPHTEVPSILHQRLVIISQMRAPASFEN